MLHYFYFSISDFSFFNGSLEDLSLTIGVSWSYAADLIDDGTQFLDLLPVPLSSPSLPFLELYIPNDRIFSFISAGASPLCCHHNHRLLVGGWIQFDSSLFSLSTSRIFGSFYIPSAVAGELLAVI